MKALRKLLVGGFYAACVALIWAVIAWPGHRIEAWNPPIAPAETGPYSHNAALLDAAVIGVTRLPGPVDVEKIGDRLYVSCTDAWIRTIDARGTVRDFAQTTGRPLGIAPVPPNSTSDPDDLLYVAVATIGLTRVATDGRVDVLAGCSIGFGKGEYHREHSRDYCFAQDVVASEDGAVYFTDATNNISILGDVDRDILSGVGTGRLVRYEAGATVELVDDLRFASGVATLPGGATLLVAETAGYRVRKVWVRGPLEGQSTVAIDNLPGLPSRLDVTSRGTFWIALQAPRVAWIDRRLHPSAFWKKMWHVVPGVLRPSPPAAGWVVEFNRSWRPIRSLRDVAGSKLAGVSSVHEVDGVVWLGQAGRDRGGVGKLTVVGQ